MTAPSTHQWNRRNKINYTDSLKKQTRYFGTPSKSRNSLLPRITSIKTKSHHSTRCITILYVRIKPRHALLKAKRKIVINFARQVLNNSYFKSSQTMNEKRLPRVSKTDSYTHHECGGSRYIARCDRNFMPTLLCRSSTRFTQNTTHPHTYTLSMAWVHTVYKAAKH